MLGLPVDADPAHDERDAEDLRQRRDLRRATTIPITVAVAGRSETSSA